MIDIKTANHTGRELELMLLGRKPLALFYEEIGFLPDEEIIPEVSFRPFVESGQFVRGEAMIEGDFHPKLGRNLVVHYVFLRWQQRLGGYLPWRSSYVFERTARFLDQKGSSASSAHFWATQKRKRTRGASIASAEAGGTTFPNDLKPGNPNKACPANSCTCFIR